MCLVQLQKYTKFHRQNLTYFLSKVYQSDFGNKKYEKVVYMHQNFKFNSIFFIGKRNKLKFNSFKMENKSLIFINKNFHHPFLFILPFQI